LESARKTWGDEPALLAELGYCYYRTENRTLARAFLEGAISKGHESASTYFHLALVFYYERMYDEALRSVKTSLTLRDPFPLAHQLAGQLLLAKTRSAALVLDTRTRQIHLEEALAHFQGSLISDERGLRDEAHNRRSQQAIRDISRALAGLE
jgi:tetratricopeptide (TPR) repeat protein